MVPDSEKSFIGLEYLCNEGDDLWAMTDEELVLFGTLELKMLGLLRVDEVEDGAVDRMRKAYPVAERCLQIAFAPSADSMPDATPVLPSKT